MPSEIFVYQIDTDEKTVEGDKFRCIAAVNDLYEFPTCPTGILKQDDYQIPYYRKDRVELVFRSAEEAEVAWGIIKEDRDDLVANFCATERMDQIEKDTTTCTSPDEPLINEVETPTDITTVQVELAFEPNGEAITDESGQNIAEPFDSELKGWLPVSEVPEAFSDPVPEGAKYFYNIDADAEVKSLFPLKTPNNLHSFSYNGQKLAIGTTYDITSDTIYWLSFEMGEYDVYGISGNAPWGEDYVDRSLPGTPVDLKLLVVTDC
jgi:hypothetical protein